MRHRLVDYSAPALQAQEKVTVKGYLHRGEMALGAEIVTDHRDSYVRGDVVYDPLHYLSLCRRGSPARWTGQCVRTPRPH